ncbi:hypothetical protein NUSPORA_02854 [Nucleospora cyclopteri]
MFKDISNHGFSLYFMIGLLSKTLCNEKHVVSCKNVFKLIKLGTYMYYIVLKHPFVCSIENVIGCRKIDINSRMYVDYDITLPETKIFIKNIFERILVEELIFNPNWKVCFENVSVSLLESKKEIDYDLIKSSLEKKNKLQNEIFTKQLLLSVIYSIGATIILLFVLIIILWIYLKKYLK